MPRLSILVVFSGSAEPLERTLLSVLEHQPHDSEVILVHDGSYADPYELGDDALVLIESDQSSSLISMVNDGCRAARAPIVHILMPGMMVEEYWAEDAMDAFRDSDVAAVSVGIDSLPDGTTLYGMEASWLPRRQLSVRASSSHPAIPFIFGGFFRKRVIAALNGFLEQVPTETAEAEFAMAIRTLGMRCMNVDDAWIESDCSLVTSCQASYASGFLAGQLANAYSCIPDSGLTLDSFLARLGHLAGGLMNPSRVAERLGWVLGVKDRGMQTRIAQRIERASHQLENWRAAQSPIIPSSFGLRRAA